MNKNKINKYVAFCLMGFKKSINTNHKTKLREMVSNDMSWLTLGFHGSGCHQKRLFLTCIRSHMCSRYNILGKLHHTHNMEYYHPLCNRGPHRLYLHLSPHMSYGLHRDLPHTHHHRGQKRLHLSCHLIITIFLI